MPPFYLICVAFWRTKAEQSTLGRLFFGQLFLCRHSDMTPAADIRRVVRARMKTKAHFATAPAQAKKYFGGLWNTTQVSGTVPAAEISTPKEKASTHLKVVLK